MLEMKGANTFLKSAFFSKDICKLSKSHYLCTAIAKIAQLVEHDLAPKYGLLPDLGKDQN
jgi:hypothetical protein